MSRLTVAQEKSAAQIKVLLELIAEVELADSACPLLADQLRELEMLADKLVEKANFLRISIKGD